MADDPKPAQKTDRRERLQAALRENLKRRKAQARRRASEVSDESSIATAAPAATDPPRDD